MSFATGPIRFMVNQSILQGFASGRPPMDTVPYQLYLQQQDQLEQMNQFAAMQREVSVQQQSIHNHNPHPYVNDPSNPFIL